MRLFERFDQALSMNELEFPGKVMTLPSSEPIPAERPENLAQLTDQLIQQSFSPAAVLVNGEGDILYFSGRTGKYLEPAAGKTTSKEELQSLNEELQTVNAELQSKVDDLTWVRNDMTNLLNSTEIATIFLDNEMKLRRFTTYATKLFKLIPGDVGRPLAHIVTDLDYPQLMEDAREVLRTLVYQEKQVVTHDGRWYRVRIMPYRTQDNVIDGVVITFIDITEIKQLEAELRERNPQPSG